MDNWFLTKESVCKKHKKTTQICFPYHIEELALSGPRRNSRKIFVTLD